MPKTKQQQVWETFRDKMIEVYGARRFQAVSGKHMLRKLFDAWWNARAVSLDVQDEADGFGDTVEWLFESPPGRNSQDATPHLPYPLTSGSMQSVSAYAEALPIVLQARQDVLGAKEPMAHQEAIRWLERETSRPANQTLVEVRFRFLVPNTVQLIQASLAGASGKAGQLLSYLEAVATPARIAPGRRRPAITHMRRVISFEHDGERHTINLLHSRSKRMDALISWADRLADRCVGAMSVCATDQPPGFEWAVWLILAGIWPRIASYGVLRSGRDRAHSFGHLTYRRQSPYIELNVLTLDMPPDEVADSYRTLRSRGHLTRRGPKMEAESEILCLAALEVKEIDRLGWEDEAAFREAVLRRYSAKAKLHGVDPARFASASGSWSKARKALRRAEAAYAKLYPPSTFPVKTPKGPRSLVVDEPTLFSKGRETDTHLM